MEFLYIINILFFFVISFVPAVYLTRFFKLPRLNVLTIPTLLMLPIQFITNFSGPFFFLDDGWFNPYFQYALLVSNVHDALAAVVLIIIVRLLVRTPRFAYWLRRAERTGSTIKPAHMRLLGLLFLALFFISFLLLTQEFGLFNWIASPRTGYQSHRTGNGQWYALCVSFLSLSTVLATVYARSSSHMTRLMPVYLGCIYLLGSKGFIIAFGIFLIIVLALRRYRYFKPVALLMGMAGLAMIVYNFASSMNSVGIAEISQYSDYYVNAALYYQRYLNGSLPLLNGEAFLSNFWALVPRALYPDKPFVYGILKINEIFYPGAAEATNTPAFATVGWFADFGWPGVICSALFNPANFIIGAAYAALLPRLQTFGEAVSRAHSTVLLYIFILIAAPTFLAFFEFPFSTILFYMFVIMIEVSNRLRLVPSTGLKTEARVV